MTALVRPMVAADRPAVAQLLARAFHDDPMMVHFAPSDARRSRMLPAYFTAVLRQAGRSGTLRVAASEGQIVGASISMPPGTYPLPTLPQLTEWRAIVAAGAAATYRNFRDLPSVDRHHPGSSHWYLMYIGTDPAAQGSGVGSELLSAVVADADSAGQPTYLVTMNPQNPAWYGRHGFIVRDEIRMGRRGPATWTMERHPRTSAA